MSPVGDLGYFVGGVSDFRAGDGQIRGVRTTRVAWRADQVEMLRPKVEATGAGIPGGVQERLFTPCNTGNPQAGNGLGLSSVSNVVCEHGGSIDCVTSATGTTFTLLLPLIQPD